jgi:hypothetical protein
MVVRHRQRLHNKSISAPSFSVVLWQQDAGRTPVGFGDNPDDIAETCRVTAEDSSSFTQRSLVLFDVMVIQIAPLASDVFCQEFASTLR